MPFITPTTPSVSTKLIPYSPQSDLYQYLRYNSSVLQTKEGDEYIQKNRTTPQRSYKCLYKVFKNDSFKLESILFNPGAFYLPIWDQVQAYNKTIEIGDASINNTTSISDTDILFHLLSDNFIQDSNGDWFAQDALGDYFPLNGEPRQRYILEPNGTSQYINTTMKAVTDYSSLTVKFYYIADTNKTLSYFGCYNGASRLGAYRVDNNSAIYCYKGDSSVCLYNAVAYDATWLTMKMDVTITGVTYTLYDENDVQIWTDSTSTVDCTQTQNTYIMNMYGVSWYLNTGISYLKIDSEEWHLGLEEVGKFCVGSSGTILEIAGYTSGIYSLDNSISNPLNSTGYLIADGITHYTTSAGADLWNAGAIVRQDPTNPTKAFAWEESSIPGGHHEYDGVDDFEATPLKEITTTGDFSIGFWYNGNDALGVINDYLLTQYIDTNNNIEIFIETTALGRNFGISVKSGGLQDYVLTTGSVPIASGWHYLFITRSYVSGASVYTLYIDNVDTTGTPSTAVTSPTTGSSTDYFNVGKWDLLTPVYLQNRFIKDMVIYNKVLSSTDRGYLYNETCSSMTDNPTTSSNCLAFYRMNESDPGSPYTDATIDSSVSGNDATPTNISGPTFFNQIAAYEQQLCDYTGQCQFPAKITGGSPNVNKNYLLNGSLEFPTCPEMVAFDSNFTSSILSAPIKVSAFVRDYEDEHFLFANTGTKLTDIIGYNTERTAITDPTLDESLSYDPNDTFTATNYDFVVDGWLLIWQSKDVYELMAIQSIVNNKITFTSATTIKFTNPLIIPVFKALLLGNPNWSATPRNIYFNCQLDFMLISNLSFNTYTPSETYDSIMVLTECNYFDGNAKSNSLQVKMITTDFKYGALEYYKNFKQSINIKTWGLKAEGRVEIANMLSLINYMNGQQRAIWIPTLQKDFEPQANIVSSQTVINVDNKGLLEFFSSDGFDRSIMLWHEGTYYYSDISNLTETDSDTEQLTLSTAFGIDIDITYDNFFICWMFKGCLNNDQVDIRYKNNQAHANLNFREVQS